MFSLKKNDAFKALILAIGGPVLMYLQTLIPGLHLSPQVNAIISFTIAYLLKNFFTDDVKEAKQTLISHADKTQQSIVINPKS